MKTVICLLTIFIILNSCGNQYKCYPSKKSRDYAQIKTDGNLIKDYWKTTLVKQFRTMKGYKLIFVTEHRDTIVRFSPCPFKVDSCYYVSKLFS